MSAISYFIEATYTKAEKEREREEERTKFRSNFQLYNTTPPINDSQYKKQPLASLTHLSMRELIYFSTKQLNLSRKCIFSLGKMSIGNKTPDVFSTSMHSSELFTLFRHHLCRYIPIRYLQISDLTTFEKLTVKRERIYLKCFITVLQNRTAKILLYR